MSDAVKDQGKGLTSPIKEYNLAVEKYNQGDLPGARAILEKLKFNGLYSDEVLSALNKIKADLQITSIEDEYSLKEEFLLNQSFLPEYFYLTISALFFLFSLFLLIKKKWIITLIPFVLACSFMAGEFIVKTFQVEINSNEVTIYRGPSKIFEELQVLPPGVRFIVTKESNRWRYIEYPKNFRGWIYDAKAIKP